jgi:hypothetical protein
MRHDAVQYDLKQLGTHGGINVIDSGFGQMIERNGRKTDLVFKSKQPWEEVEKIWLLTYPIGDSAPLPIHTSTTLPIYTSTSLPTYQNAYVLNL